MFRTGDFDWFSLTIRSLFFLLYSGIFILLINCYVLLQNIIKCYKMLCLPTDETYNPFFCENLHEMKSIEKRGEPISWTNILQCNSNKTNDFDCTFPTLGNTYQSYFEK